MSEHIDQSGVQPTLADEPRVSVLDVRDVYVAEGEDVERACGALGVGEEQVRAAVAYYREHEAEMEELRAENERVLKETVSLGE